VLAGRPTSARERIGYLTPASSLQYPDLSVEERTCAMLAGLRLVAPRASGGSGALPLLRTPGSGALRRSSGQPASGGMKQKLALC